ncbi:uncharacterized protein LOC141794857 isoform X2 [Halichoeres trimaculatus]|uniref:uncharacterized protein LOC141794857 isoform X2 n=1 Tax=Halichoeres trimaculatus TaxID=147232 RepID=UPI003D9F8748
MKNAVTVGENTTVSRQEVFEDYLDCFLQRCTEAGPCHDEQLLKKTALYLQREPQLKGTFTVFPFYESIQEGYRHISEDWRRFLSAVIKATELLETLCVNILLQPWKKEIKTVKTFTGPFVYCLLSVFNISTIQCILASVGYLPNTDTPSEYRLCEEANQDRVKLVGFELMLARVECYHLLELHDRSKVQQQWLEVLHERLGSTKLEGSTEEKTIVGKEDERKNEEADGKELSLHLDCRPSVTSQHKPLHCNTNYEDQSFIEMQMTYPDLAIRGRPLLSDKPHQAKSGSRASCKASHNASISVQSDESKAAKLPHGNSVKGIEAFSATACCKSDVSRADKVCDDDVPCSGCNDMNSGGDVATKDILISSLCTSGDEDHGPARFLHNTLRNRSRAGPSQRPGQPLPPAEAPAWTQEQIATGSQEHPPLSPTDMKDIRELEDRMDELSLQEAKKEVMTKQNRPTRREKTNQ